MWYREPITALEINVEEDFFFQSLESLQLDAGDFPARWLALFEVECWYYFFQVYTGG